MIILAESNFVLELAFQQQQVDDAECIVRMAEERRIQLAIPACCFFEPYETFGRRVKQRNGARTALTCEAQQLERSRPFADLATSASCIATGLGASTFAEGQALNETIHRLLKCCFVCTLTDAVIESAKAFESRFRLKPQDAMVLASVHAHVAEHIGVPKAFVSRDENDFSNERVVQYLAALDCKILYSFTSARRYAESQAGRA